jgi:hypothetical protein
MVGSADNRVVCLKPHIDVHRRGAMSPGIVEQIADHPLQHSTVARNYNRAAGNGARS